MNQNVCPSGSTSCVNTIGSFTCICQNGFKYINNACQDIDECALNLNSCEEICLNINGSFKCDCSYGFKLTDVTKCVKGKSKSN